MTERIVERQCVRPGCTRPAVATLAFRYDTRQAWLSALAPEPVPATYDLCGVCAGRTNPPRGWYLVDERPDVEPAAAPADAATVAVLAAALADAPESDPARAADPAAQAAVDAPAIDDTEVLEPPDAAETAERRHREVAAEAADARHEGGLRSVPNGGPVTRSEPFAARASGREGVRPVMAALLGEAEGPMVSLSAVEDVAAPPPASPRPDAPASEVRARPAAEVDAGVPPVTEVGGTGHAAGEPDAPRLFAVPSHHAPRGTASVW